MSNEQFKKNNDKMQVEFHPNLLKPLSPRLFYCFDDDEQCLDENRNRIEIRSPTRSKSPHLKQLKVAIDELEDEFRKLNLEKDDQLFERADQIDRLQHEWQRIRHRSQQKLQSNRKKVTGTIVEPNIRQDDLFYRNLKQKKRLTRTIEKHPPFGIPLRPIRYLTSIDYLNDPLIECKQKREKKRNKLPDLLLDDLAYRSLRKDVFARNGLPTTTTTTANINFEYTKMCQLLIRCLAKVSKEFRRIADNHHLTMMTTAIHHIDYNNNIPQNLTSM